MSTRARIADGRRFRCSGRQLAARISGDSTVAHSLAFARAVEAAIGVGVPRRAVWLRALMAELERLANHLGDIGAICNDAAFAFMLAECGLLREKTLRTADACFGHRLMMDRIVPGGVAVDLPEDGRTASPHSFRNCGAHSPRWWASMREKPPSRTAPSATGGSTCRRSFIALVPAVMSAAPLAEPDARRSPGYAPYDELDFSSPSSPKAMSTPASGSASGRSKPACRLIEQILVQLPDGPIQAELSRRAAKDAPL